MHAGISSLSSTPTRTDKCTHAHCNVIDGRNMKLQSTWYTHYRRVQAHAHTCAYISLHALHMPHARVQYMYAFHTRIRAVHRCRTCCPIPLRSATTKLKSESMLDSSATAPHCHISRQLPIVDAKCQVGIVSSLLHHQPGIIFPIHNGPLQAHPYRYDIRT